MNLFVAAEAAAYKASGPSRRAKRVEGSFVACAPQDDNEKHKRAKNLAGVIATERVEGSRERRGERQSLRSGFFLSLLKAVP